MRELSADEPMVRDVVLDVRLPQTTATDRVQVRRIAMRPGHPAGLHVHNGPVVGSIVDGAVIFQVDGEPERRLGPGDVFYEPEGARIARFDAGPDGVTFLAYYLLGDGREPAIAFPAS
jgi:quercetin dioxygenase-like cupin family protein